MVLRVSQTNLVFTMTDEDSMNCYKRIIRLLSYSPCYGYSVYSTSSSLDNHRGVDTITLSIEFWRSEVLEDVAKIIKEYEENK